jgi:hypothetical protein
MEPWHLFSTLARSNGGLLHQLHWLFLWVALLLFGISAVYANEISLNGKRRSATRLRRRLLRQHFIASIHGFPRNPSSDKMLSVNSQPPRAWPMKASAEMLVRFGKKCAMTMANAVRRVLRLGTGSPGTTDHAYTPFLLAICCCTLVLTYFLIHPPALVAHYNCFPTIIGERPVCFGVTEVEGPNAYEFCDIVSGTCREIRICPGFDSQLRAGYALAEFHTIETGSCESLAPERTDLYYKIIRGKDERWQHRYGALTYNNGKDRPVIARNCHPTKTSDGRDDTYCDGGKAVFVQEISQGAFK